MSLLLLRVTVLTVLAALSLAAEGTAYTANEHHDDIPARCTENSVTPVTCAGAATVDGLVVHPDDCTLFYYCVAEHLPPVCRQCPADLHFNPDKHVCDQPEDAGCRLAQ